MKTDSKGIFIAGILLLIVGLCFFIASRLRLPQAIEADFSAIYRQIKSDELMGSARLGNEAELKRNFNILPSSFQEMLYLAPDNFMEVDELLLLRFSSEESAVAIRDSMEKRLTSLMNNFESYGTDQYSLLQKAQIYQNDAYICYTAGHFGYELMQLLRSHIER